MKLFIKRAWAAWILAPVLFSCATYNKSMDGYYNAIRSQDYDKAARSLEHNKLINKSRNAVLFNLEMGRVLRLKGDYAGSNNYLNRADALMESGNKSISDIALANLVNPMQSTYLGEDFEKFMVHYYKALNYSALGQTEDAVVEARRITLTSNAQGDKFNNKDSRYSKDAFALNMQGMIYESAGDINNAFISYRNATEAYTKSGGEYYGVPIPSTLKNDLVRTSGLMGFTSDLQQYEKIFNISYREPAAVADSNQSVGELVLFIEEGQAPVKQQKEFFLTAGKNGLGSFNYIDANGYNSDFNFNYSAYGIPEDKLSSLRAYRIALPQYVIQYNTRKNIVVSGNGNSYTPILAEDLNNIAVNTMKERFLTEMANALARQITKKLVEKGTEAAATAIAKKDDKKEEKTADEKQKEEEKKKKEEKAKEAGQVAGFLVNIVNTVTEKADTRNWQSLPAYISYVRIPLHEGVNDISVNAGGKLISLKVNGAKGLQMMGVNAD